MLLEQFGGANGELAAAMQYSIQGLNCEEPERKDLLMDIGTEELSHLEIVGTLARMHLKPMKFDRQAAEADPLIAIAGGGGVNLFNSQGNAWTADYLKITGELDVDLRSNIAAEARTKIVYERLIDFCDDAGTKDALQFLMTREITHMKAFALALESMGKPAFSIGRIAPTPGFLAAAFGLQNDLTMRRKSKLRSSSTKLSPRSAGDADIEIGRRIRLRRRETGISQTELAGHLGLSFQQMQKYEKGINRIGAARLQQIAKMLCVDIPFFYDGDGKEPDVDSLLVVNRVFSLRLLRAYTAIKDKVVQRRLVILVEMIAASQR